MRTNYMLTEFTDQFTYLKNKQKKRRKELTEISEIAFFERGKIEE